ncbi:glycerol-3-phosphate cytidylyltransferase [Periweissella cryptocerci]|uniref:Glycerol-3-phosphate cytidylyltransferase n=1 Tax=Periweissella cryptocerci TaxID=2506420 RepID=A0A4P6YW57_9LACO|nr:adenylyltransferase/cytidyltransferase family protein [Periweissella cryptocerci]QBO37082.1 glycerol-3-phosphate cytidylyltransferase [Periweissella cryptocerci]
MKKSKIGFTAGTFDMFHIGHLNLLKAAKERTEYLIVGVNAADLVFSYKKKYPLIAEEQRLAIVEAIKYVDEVHVMDSLDKMDAWEKYKFDTVFIGSDYKGSERYKQEEIRLAKVGAMVDYLPYTESISSTDLAKRVLDDEANKVYFKEHLDGMK